MFVHRDSQDHGAVQDICQPVRPGFTLVELLVVISIIVLLLSLLVPAIDKAFDVAEQTVCATNLKNLGNGYVMYAADYDRSIPDARKFGVGRVVSSTEEHSWHTDHEGNKGIAPIAGRELEYPGGQLYPYAIGEDMYACPTFESTFDHPEAVAHLESHPTPAERQPGLSYVAHSGTAVGGWDYLSIRRINGPWHDSLKKIRHQFLPSKTLLLSEEGTYVFRPWGYYPRNDTALSVPRWLNPAMVTDSLGNYHMPLEGETGSVNVLMFDGHVTRDHAKNTKSLVYPSRQMFKD